MSHSVQKVDLWKSVVARLSPAIRGQLLKVVSVSDAPDLQHLIEDALAIAKTRNGRSGLANLLLDRGVLAEIISAPDLLEFNEAVDLMKAAVVAEPRFDLALLRHLTDPSRTWPEDVSPAEMMRVLDLLRATTGIRPHLVMLMRRFLRVSDPQVRSRAVRLVSVSYPAFVESAFGDPDARVRSNILEAVCDGLAVLSAPARSLLARAASDSSHRVATTALYFLAKHGKEDARQKLNEMMNHTDPAYRRAAAWALGKLNEVPAPEKLPAAPEPALEPVAAMGPSEP